MTTGYNRELRCGPSLASIVFGSLLCFYRFLLASIAFYVSDSLVKQVLPFLALCCPFEKLTDRLFL